MTCTTTNTLSTCKQVLSLLEKNTSLWIYIQPVKATAAALRTCLRRIDNAAIADSAYPELQEKVNLARTFLNLLGATDRQRDLDQAQYLLIELGIYVDTLIQDEDFRARYVRIWEAEPTPDGSF